MPSPRLPRVDPLQEHTEALLEKARASGLAQEAAEELRQDEEIDDYLSILRRLMCNLSKGCEAAQHLPTWIGLQMGVRGVLSLDFCLLRGSSTPPTKVGAQNQKRN